MDDIQAREFLEFEMDEIITAEKCKKKYKMMALKYHPDKNPDQDTSLQFIKINEAYQYLSSRFLHEDFEETSPDYRSLFLSFVKNILGGNNESLFDIFLNIEKKISSLLSHQEDIKPILIKMVQPMDKDILIKMYTLTNKYGVIFHISEVLKEVLKEAIEEKNNNESCIVLHPFIDDLFEEKLYKLILFKNETHIVPLWHHELVYDEDIRVKCIPLLADNVHIDSNNNILVSLQMTIEEIFRSEEIRFELGERVFSFERKLLKMKKEQIYKIRGRGIPIINTFRPFDVSIKSDIIVSVFLVT
jgi:hypothetical protein